MRIVGSAHWLVPWLVLLVGLFSIVRFARGYINESAFTDTDRRLMAIFSGMMDLQGALGLAFFLGTGFAESGFPIDRILHGIIMLFAVVIPHFSSNSADADDHTRHLNNFFLVLASFLLMLVGLAFVH